MQAGVTRRAVLRSAGGAAAVAACGSLPATGAQQSGRWPMFGRDGANTGYAPDGTGPTGDVGGVWRFDTAEAIASSPAVVDGTVYVGGNDGNLYALSAAAGTREWQFTTGGRVSSSPAVVDGTVYVGSEDGSVYGIDSGTGEEVWRFETGDPVVSSPTVVDGTVYVGSRDDRVYAIDAADGTEQWSFPTANDVSGTPAVVDGTVYVGSEDWILYAIDADAGEELWQFETGGAITAGPAVSGGTVYVGSLDGVIYAVSEGELQWGLETGGPIVSSPAVADGTVYVGSRDGRLYALGADSGDQLWQFETETGRQVSASPSVAGGVVYVGTQGGAVVGIDTDGGDQLWQFDAVRAVTAGPAVLDGRLFVGSGTGAVYALEEGGQLSGEATPTPAGGGSGPGGGGGNGSGLDFLLLPLSVVGFVAFLAGSAYIATRAGVFDPIVARSPFPPEGETTTDPATGETAGESQATEQEEPTGGSDEPAFPVRDVVLDDVIGRAEETSRTATQDLLVTKYVDRETLSSPVVAYEVESVRREPAIVRITESLDADVDPGAAIGRLPGGPDEWRVEDGSLVFEAVVEPDEIVRTIVARRDLSPEEADSLLDRPGVDVEE
jgi:outer membrane protein assembly factor BamB